MSYLDLLSDPRRRMDMLAFLQGGMLPLDPATGSPVEAPDAPGSDQLLLDEFSLESAVEGEDLAPFFQQLQTDLAEDPELLRQLNDIRERLGLEPFAGPGETGLQDPSALMPGDVTALLIMWALQQQDEENGGRGRGSELPGRLPQQTYSNVRPADTNWGGTNTGGGRGGGAPSTSGGGSTSATGGGSATPTAIPGGPVPDLPDNIGPVTPGQNGVPAGLNENAARGAALVRQVFGFEGTIGGLGERPNKSDHPHGNAIDVMTNENMEQGQQIADFFVKHAEELGVKYVIFNQRIASPRTGWQWEGMEDRGSPTANHMDHPHISFEGPE